MTAALGFIAGFVVASLIAAAWVDGYRRSRNVAREALAETMDALKSEREAFLQERRELLNRAQARDFGTFQIMQAMDSTGPTVIPEPKEKLSPRFNTGAEL